jgi:hypothetical protein
VVQRSPHGNAGHHGNAALLGGRDQALHGNLPVLALGYCRRQRQDEDVGIAQTSRFASIAGRNRIKQNGGTNLFTHRRARLANYSPDFKTRVPPAVCRQRLKVGDVHAGPRICL